MTFWAALAMARHVHRMQQAEKHGELLPKQMYEALIHVPRIDAITSTLGSVWSLHPDGYHSEDSWPAHLQWGADQLVETVRHLRAGRMVAALAMVRRQLERWTLNVAQHFGVEPAEDENKVVYFTRVWAEYPWLRADIGQAWAELSECLHGRGSMGAAQSWEAAAGDVRTATIQVPQATLDLNQRMADIAGTVFTQVRGGVRTLAQQAGRDSWAMAMLSNYSVREVPDLLEPGRVAIMPLDPAYAYSSWADNATSAARGYRLVVTAAGQNGTLLDLPTSHVMGAVLERRGRAIDRFRMSMEREIRVLGDDYQPGTLEARLFRYVAISEAAEVISDWSSPEEAACLRLAAGALRSAFYLWLEDTDIAMACVRVLLEQTCQARAWRTKPQRAKRISELKGTVTSSARWIEASGWRRAKVLGQALGEFSHVDLRAAVFGARRLLGAIQAEDVAESERPYKARGHALDSTAYLLAFEVSERLMGVDEGLAEGFREQITLLDAVEHSRRIEDLLARVHDLRSFDFRDL
ncbi:hypothetical protein [Kribbella speibonae]|uniref:Uncharacterized protein n=1 Tax=Kribbella speibonae TaxID=1572660 RepID=A0A4R0J4R8_9ACTN|nr:hypothetical protein [Kribbella speibonae]TCC36275.1 hypothetical protein E0H92_26850 [Kribbella speibonae]